MVFLVKKCSMGEWGHSSYKPADQVRNILNFEVWLPWTYFTGLEKKLEFQLVLWEGSE